MEYVNALAKFSGAHTITYRRKGAEADEEVSAANILIGASVPASVRLSISGIDSGKKIIVKKKTGVCGHGR